VSRIQFRDRLLALDNASYLIGTFIAFNLVEDPSPYIAKETDGYDEEVGYESKHGKTAVDVREDDRDT
jgi:hypothetical protein